MDWPADAQQTSPLMLGSAALEALADGVCAGAVVCAPRNTVERRYVLAQALRALAPGAPLVALAGVDKGGNRIARELEGMGCAVHVESRQHHKIVHTVRPETPELAEAIAAGGLRFEDALGLWTQPGIFSWDRVDAGSALLLQHLPAFHGAGADLGCGLGILSLAVLKSAAVTTLTLMDIDQRAIHAAQKNITDARAHFIWGDVRSAALAPASLDFVVMNPPFHAQGIENKALGQAFLQAAAGLLKPGGQLWLTANIHLPYEAVLAQHFAQHMLVDEAEGYKIYRGIR